MFYLHVYAPCVYSALRGQKKAPDPLELELHKVVSLHDHSGDPLEPSISSAPRYFNIWGLNNEHKV